MAETPTASCLQPYPHSGIPCLEMTESGLLAPVALLTAETARTLNFTLDFEYAERYQQ
ncbi:MAG: hypothetical protein AAF490_29735 [Chloroflexota bacterium]